MKKKVAIIGGRGMLGGDIFQACENRGIDCSVFDLPEFDITNRVQLAKVAGEYGVIINCAAYTNVEKAESESELAFKVNGEAVGLLGEVAKANESHVIHISTDFVFDGKSGNSYVETDETNPLSVYGASKLAGEKMLAKSGCRYCILRVEWTYGKCGPNNFVRKMLNMAHSGKSLRVVDDQIGSPTATTEVAEVICDIISRERLEGLYHFAAAGYVSRYEMAKFIFRKIGLSVDLSACKTSDYKSAAARPLNSRFNCDKISGALGMVIKPWQGPLERFLE